MAKIVINTDLNTKNFDKQIAKLESDIKRYTSVLESDAQVPIHLRLSPQEREELEALIERLRNQLLDLKNKAKDVGDVGEDAGEKSGKGFEKGLKSLKKFGMALLGVRGLFTLVRRATNSYLNEHQDTANKLNAIWVALGNALGPIIEIIADGVLQLIGYLNVFLRALGFDVDLTKNMNKSTKAIKETTGAMKELNRETYSFDEMNKQSKDTSTSGGGIGGVGGENGFTMPKLNEDIVKFLENTAKWLKENWELIGLIAIAIGGLKLAKWLSGLSSLIGGEGTGLLGITNLLKGLLAFELITIAISIIYYGMKLNELKELNGEIEKLNKQNTKDAKKVNDNNRKVAESYEKGSKEVNKYVRSLKDQIEQSKNVIDAKKKENSEISGLNEVWDMFGGTQDKNVTIMKENIQRTIDATKNMQELAKQGKLTDDQMKYYNETMEYLNQEIGIMTEGMSQAGDINSFWNIKMDESTESLYTQIEALKKDDQQIKNTFRNGKNEIGDFGTAFGKISNLVATPQIKMKANVDDIKTTLSKLSNIAVLNVGNVITNALSKMRSVGLARGGIVNNPGKGVPIGSVITGEATNGAEGVIPMNNDEVMDMLGQKIARHIQINLTNNTLLDSRVIAREQTKIASDMNFLTNGRGV